MQILSMNGNDQPVILIIYPYVPVRKALADAEQLIGANASLCNCVRIPFP